MAWALWAVASWGLGLSGEALKAISAMEDDVVALLALYSEAEGLFPAGGLNKAKWAAITAHPAVLGSEHWLLAYEANRNGWLGTPAVAADPVFSAMHAAGISFFDGSMCTPLYPAAALPLPGGQLPDYYA